MNNIVTNENMIRTLKACAVGFVSHATIRSGIEVLNLGRKVAILNNPLRWSALSGLSFIVDQLFLSIALMASGKKSIDGFPRYFIMGISVIVSPSLMAFLGFPIELGIASFAVASVSVYLASQRNLVLI
jgi:hypothetical protein